MIKLIASDMDGTLLNEYDEIDKETFSIIKNLKDKNILFVAASGRQYYNLLNKFSEVKNDIIFAAENGSYVVYKGKELYSNPIDREVVNSLIDVGRKIDGCEFILCGKKAAYIEKSYAEFLKEVKKYYLKYEVVDSFDEVTDDILKFTVCDFKDPEKNSKVIFYSEFKDIVQIAVSGKVWLDITNQNVNKGVAIDLLQKKFNIKPEETMVFGDYFNDVDMFHSAYHSYAMANAPIEVKKHARFTAMSNRENGVLRVIKEKVIGG